MIMFEDVDGGTGLPLVGEPDDLRVTGPAPSPDGRYVAGMTWPSR